jgi:hypothetical protein
MGGCQEGTNLHLKKKTRVESLRGLSRQCLGRIALLRVGNLEGVKKVKKPFDIS